MMTKILMMLMLLVSTNALAVDWVKIGETGNGSFTHYVDPQSIRRDGNKVRAWVMNDYKSDTILSDTKIIYLSVLVRAEYDCFEDTERFIDIYYYSGKMGGGNIVLPIPNITKPAESVIPGSNGATELKLVCATK